MAGECDKDVIREEIKPTDKTEKKSDDIRDENLLEDILVNQHPHSKNKIYKTDSLADILNVST
jgi:hypothetical protein